MLLIGILCIVTGLFMLLIGIGKLVKEIFNTFKHEDTHETLD